MKNESLKKAQEYVDKRKSIEDTNNKMVYDDTIAAISHLNENLNYYLKEVSYADSGSRNERIIGLLQRHFVYLDKKSVRKFLNKKFVFTNMCFFWIQLVTFTLISTLLFFFVFDIKDNISIFLYCFFSFIVICACIPIISAVYDDSNIIRFYRIKKDL